MACMCGGKTETTKKPVYEHTTPDGRTTTYSSKTEADAAKDRKGGLVKTR